QVLTRSPHPSSLILAATIKPRRKRYRNPTKDLQGWPSVRQNGPRNRITNEQTNGSGDKRHAHTHADQAHRRAESDRDSRREGNECARKEAVEEAENDYAGGSLDSEPDEGEEGSD
ncbi:MAG: hypothetical protein M1830_004007, partial [Pleopsidium flavum]